MATLNSHPDTHMQKQGWTDVFTVFLSIVRAGKGLHVLDDITKQRLVLFQVMSCYQGNDVTCHETRSI